MYRIRELVITHKLIQNNAFSAQNVSYSWIYLLIRMFLWSLELRLTATIPALRRLGQELTADLRPAWTIVSSRSVCIKQNRAYILVVVLTGWY